MNKKNIKDLGGEFFYCYSLRTALFVRAMGIRYEEVGEHPETGAIYTKFLKTKKLHEVLKLWNKIKYRFDDMMDDGTVVIGYGKNIHHR